jgi:hydrophobic/amphiphilic exporter-1 (mainly G- bacteria), HAE1 family
MNSSIQVDRNFWIDSKSGNQYFIVVQYPEKTDRSLEEVLSIPVSLPGSTDVVTLGTFVKVSPEYPGPAEVIHENLARVFSVKVNTDGRDIGSLARKIERRLAPVRAELPAGMVLTMSGEYQRMVESFGNLGGGLALAALLVYLLMVAQFRSYLSPLIIMFAVPLGLIGVLFTLYLTRTTLNVQSAMGVIFMVGIVVANSTLLVDFANRQRAAGVSVHDAIANAARIRLRPILMTFLATFLDLLPMAIGIGKGSEANVPLARAVVGGLLASTVLTLIVVPVLYTVFHRDQIQSSDSLVAGPANDVAIT